MRNNRQIRINITKQPPAPALWDYEVVVRTPKNRVKRVVVTIPGQWREIATVGASGPNIRYSQTYSERTPDRRVVIDLELPIPKDMTLAEFIAMLISTIESTDDLEFA